MVYLPLYLGCLPLKFIILQDFIFSLLKNYVHTTIHSVLPIYSVHVCVYSECTLHMMYMNSHILTCCLPCTCRYQESAMMYAQTQNSFEEIALKFIKLDGKDALKSFIQKKLSSLRTQVLMSRIKKMIV